MTVRDLLTALQTLPRDAELLAFEAGCEDYCEREVDELELQGWPGSWKPSRGSGWARRTSRQGMQISTVNRPSISLKGPVKVPQKEQCGPTPHPRCSNWCSTTIAGAE
jgi:hypothetical protein